MLRCIVKQMKLTAQIGVRAGFLVSIPGPLLAFVLYPRAKWLFALPLIGLPLMVLQILTSREPTPQEIAGRAERILSGTCGAWDVDDYGHLNPKNPAVQNLWHSTMPRGLAGRMGAVGRDETERDQR